MRKTTVARKVQRPWTALVGAATAAHHTFELSNGIGLVWQPEFGLAGATALWGTQIPVGIALAARGSRRWDKVLAVWSGANLGGALVHFWLWPSRRNRVGLPILTEAEGLDAARLPAYNTLLYVWAGASVLSIAREIYRPDRRWALLGIVALPLLRISAKHHFAWITEQARTNPAWWNKGLQPDEGTSTRP